MAIAWNRHLTLALTSSFLLTACEDGSKFNLFEKKAAQTADAMTVVSGDAVTTIERDVEAPDVFQQTDEALWDGRPSLGGVWVAHPDVTDPERVIIRNQSNGNFVIGALFRRERENPGPRFQVSSEAAEALGMLAGAPGQLNVTALRREEVPLAPEVSEPALDTAEPIEQTTLDPVASVAASAISEIEAAAQGASSLPVTTGASAAPPPKPTAAKPVEPTKSTLEKPFVQIGIFSVQANADGTADMLRAAGVIPTIKTSLSSGKKYWRVLAGPATSGSDRSALIKKVKELGFSDAYAVTH